MTRRKRGEAGFSFIEILVVMGIISVLVSMVVVLIPKLQERSNQTKSKDNIKNMITLMLDRQIERGWPRYSGKNFVLSLVATGQLDRRNSQNLEILFSPGDVLYKLNVTDHDRYQDVTKEALKAGTDFHEMTSYAGRRNGDREYLITPDQMQMGTIIMCDDDDGPLHHPGGLCVGYTNGSVKFMEWEDLDMIKPDDPDAPDEFLGDASSHPDLQRILGR
jgi:prepilin-type N-terminal cleavage/methylation domain-containing protein